MSHNFCGTEQEKYEVEQRTSSSNKSVWNVLVVFGALMVGAAAGFWFSEQRNAARYQEVENELAKLEQALEGERRSQKGATLQAYFEQMTPLLLERDLRTSEEDSEVQRLARARTLATVANLDAEGNKNVTRFLTELDLVTGTDPVRLLSGSYLPGADLAEAFLPAADLYVSMLGNADLSGAFLISSNLSGADLREANLSQANLRYANLEDAVLEGANLRDADLSEALLKGADLSGANLTNAKITDEQLDTCKSLEGATMPNGSKHP
jgi:uncharacterized protein YjbI with pentapeptide repeats